MALCISVVRIRVRTIGPAGVAVSLFTPVLLATVMAQSGPALPGSPPKIPLMVGLTLVTAINDKHGDYESIKRIETTSGDLVRIKYSSERPKPLDIDEVDDGKPRPIERLTTYRTVRRADLASAAMYLQQFQSSIPETVSNTTAIGVSSAILTALRSKGEATLTVFQTIIPGMFVDPNTRQPGQLDFRLTSTIKRVEPKPVPFPVIVNDRRVELPAVHAKGTFVGEEGDFLFLDDPNNPLSLRFTIGQDHLNVVKLSFPPQDSGGAQLAPELARALEEHGRTEVHGIYFEFASAAIKPESEPVLVAIATMLAQHPTWKVSVEGHTDNIGGDAYNLDLSRRRSAAVRDALAKRYQVGADRLTTAGFGVSRPKETNDTLEGRARNRRVELVRQ